MPSVVCTICAAPGWWRAMKHSRLAAHRCSSCGGKLTLAKKPRARHTGPKITCVLCQRSGYRWFVQLTQPMTFEKTWRHGKHGRTVITQIEDSPLTVAPAGAIVCDTHVPVEIQELERIQHQERDAFAMEHQHEPFTLDTPTGDAYETMLTRHRAEAPTWAKIAIRTPLTQGT